MHCIRVSSCGGTLPPPTIAPLSDDIISRTSLQQSDRVLYAGYKTEACYRYVIRLCSTGLGRFDVRLCMTSDFLTEGRMMSLPGEV